MRFHCKGWIATNRHEYCALTCPTTDRSRTPERSGMMSDARTPSQPHRLPALLSALVPGLGQAVRRQGRQAALAFGISTGLLGTAWGIDQAGERGASIFFLILVVLPWWTIQSYEAWLPGPAALRRTLTAIWSRAHDIRYLGALFFLTALTDLSIIVANPDYALTVFCVKPAGVWGLLAKAQSPTLHTLIGYGFMRLRRWSLLLYLAYAAFGFLNATSNYACFGYGRIRTLFLLTLIAFTAYVLWRRQCFGMPQDDRPRL